MTTRRRARKNPSPPPVPPRRPSPAQLQSSLARVRRIAGSVNERERPFNPERPGSWRGSSRDLVVNGQLDTFTRACIEAALWSTNDESREDGGDPLDKNYSIDDIDPHTLNELSEQCERFQEENAEDLAEFDDSQTGHDFWLTRCGHGAGFWDGDYPEPQATRLTKAAERYGNVDLYVGDDGVIYAMGYEPNGEQQHFPFGSKRAGALEIPMVEFDWEQIDGDVNLGAHGGIIARCDGQVIDLVEIQPVREYVGDGEAAEVGFPFWTKEATYDADDLSPTNKNVKAAIESSELDLDDVEPRHLASAIAVACMRYGHGSEEGDGGWAGDKKPGEEGRANLLGSRKVRWGYAGVERKTFAEECGDEDDEFRREVLGESYKYKMTYETWDEEALEAGETDDKGWVEEGSAEEGLDDLLNNSDIKDHNWVEWSDSNPDGKRSWLIAEEEEDTRTGERTVYNLWIERADGKPKSQEEIDAISEKLGISNFGRMRRNRK